MAFDFEPILPRLAVSGKPAAHPVAVFGAIGLVIAAALVNANREVLSRVPLPDLRPAFFTEYPDLSRALLLVLFAAVLIGARSMGF